MLPLAGSSNTVVTVAADLAIMSAVSAVIAPYPSRWPGRRSSPARVDADSVTVRCGRRPCLAARRVDRRCCRLPVVLAGSVSGWRPPQIAHCRRCAAGGAAASPDWEVVSETEVLEVPVSPTTGESGLCLLYTSGAADEED